MMKMHEHIPDAAVRKLLKAWEHNVRCIPRTDGLSGPPNQRCRSSIAALLRKYRVYAHCDLL